MRYFSMISADGDSRLAVEPLDGTLVDVTSLQPELTELEDLALAAALSGGSIDDITARILGSGDADRFDLAELMDNSRQGEGYYRLDRPFEPSEVWAAGVTYKTSEMERRRESDTPDIYSDVYTADRPEIFFKATSDRCVGPFESIGIRGDSQWNVPEPELAFVLFRDEIIGYTIGNDVSSRSIVGENPLYAPQAKLYDRCCAIGPCFVTSESIGAVGELTIRCAIDRDGEEVWRDETSTSLMTRSCEELADWVQRHNPLPDMATVLTGTGIVPPPEFTLLEGDVVAITIDGIGVLENDVVVV